jgi:predicted cupin superfamily sugar epimerase
MLNPQQIISHFGLEPHPEGGFYRETYRSAEELGREALPPRFKGNRVFGTAIYFLLEGTQFSAFHRIQADELWHFYDGCGLHIHVLHPGGRGEVLRLGSDLAGGYSFQHIVPAGCWFASKPVDEKKFSFVGCTVAPGFDFEDFELAQRKELLQEYPRYEDWIRLLALP